MMGEPKWLTEKVKAKFDYEIFEYPGCRVVKLTPKGQHAEKMNKSVCDVK